MKTYATRKESMYLFTASRKEQRGKSYIKGKKCNEGGTTFDEAVARILEEFSGEVVGRREISLYRIENLI